jgi:chromosome partitioning protein
MVFLTGGGDMSKIISVTNHKGGVGKTTTVLTLGHALALLEKRVLLVDLDPQMNLSQTLEKANWDKERNLHTALRDRKIPLSTLIQSTRIPHLDLIPSSEFLRGADVEFFRKYDSALLLSKALTHAIREDYDVVLIDCPPALNILTINALAASDHCIIPITPGMYSLFGIEMLTDEIDEVRAGLNTKLTVLGVLITNFDRRVRVQRDVAEQIRSTFGAQVFDSEIGVNASIQAAQSQCRTIYEYARTERGADDYTALAEEVIRRAQV